MHAALPSRQVTVPCLPLLQSSTPAQLMTDCHPPPYLVNIKCMQPMWSCTLA